MINSISGKIFKKEPTTLYIENNGIVFSISICLRDYEKLPSENELSNIIINLKNFLKMNFNKKHNFRILYGGSVDSKSIHKFKKIKHLDGFLIGGASKSSKKFIDIIKNFYK